ncbi:hypothetical protein [Xenorhabdus sp. KK7.4]|uniref:hypothetical protein n=1 Tax=Xenorhabdus sp. KK7.4 TaxID=1851572 RepID=UPI000C04B99C|nr:hypothetical protein [Xenorhabdus sp. KK7.4]PHM47621.1 hypothetical protein Xekk_04503 [Xenorhabdus sp. KK7.4]
MGFNVHITRVDLNDYYDDPDRYSDESANISMQEWIDYINQDDEMRLDGYAEALFSNGETLICVDESMAVWTQHPDQSITSWFWLDDGMITAKNPDSHMIKKMHSIAKTLNAKVQGEDCYDIDKEGKPIIPPEGLSFRELKPWWKFW